VRGAGHHIQVRQVTDPHVQHHAAFLVRTTACFQKSRELRKPLRAVARLLVRLVRPAARHRVCGHFEERVRSELPRRGKVLCRASPAVVSSASSCPGLTLPQPSSSFAPMPSPPSSCTVATGGGVGTLSTLPNRTARSFFCGAVNPTHLRNDSSAAPANPTFWSLPKGRAQR
jgi:hypothetical protein